MLLHLVVSAVLACHPAPPRNQTFKGPGVKLRQTVSERGVVLELIDARGKVRWKLTDKGVFHPVFSADGRWVAEASTIHDDRVRVWDYQGKRSEYHPLTLASEDEKSAMGYTSCGIPWYGGMRFKGGILVVLLNQAPPRPPIYDPDPKPKLEILIDVASEKMSRRDPAKVVTVESLITRYRTVPGAQLEAAEYLWRKSGQPEGEQLSELATFAKDELPKTNDTKVQATLLRILDRTGTEADREWVGQKALEANWPPFAVLSLLQPPKGKPELLLAYSRAVLEQKLPDNNARATAVQTLAAAPGGLKYLQLGLSDQDRYVREAAEGALRDLPASDENFDWLIEQAEMVGARTALLKQYVEPLVNHTPNPWLARFEKACDANLQAKWPGCEAWTGAMADARGERMISKLKGKPSSR
ncbi:MAG: hypothetical protein JXR83_07875 [Deltaproteobacteria bacterium]|nr:hypothetical protein [Deltaproteobacteria bacterium]